jgi:large subunit ribosomal protein L13
MKGFTNSTASLKPREVQKKWILIDAKDAVVGRLATFIAMRLRGKHRPDYTPHVDCGDNVVIVNAEKVRFTGKKAIEKVFYSHTGYPGGIKERNVGQILSGRYPERVLRKAVERMLPKESPLAHAQLKHLRIYAGSEHPHAGQAPEIIPFGTLNAKNTIGGIVNTKRTAGHAISNRSAFDPSALERLGGDASEEVAARATVKLMDLENLAGDVERLSLDLDDDNVRRVEAALRALAALYPKLDTEACLANPLLRRILRSIPDRLLQALAENLASSETAKAAALAIVACVHPDHYRERPVIHHERQALADLERIFDLCHIDCFSTVRLEPAKEQTAVVEAQLWTDLPFTLDGKTPRLPKSNWLSHDGGLGIELDGANLVNTESLPGYGNGPLATARVTLEPDAETGSDTVVLYLTHADRVFDRFVYDAEALFEPSPT